MHSRRDLNTLARIKQLRQVQIKQVEGDLFRLKEQQRQREEKQHSAKQDAQAMQEEWSRTLSNEHVLPNHIRYWSREVIKSQNRCEVSARELRISEMLTSLKQTEYASADVALQQAKQLSQKARRRYNRKCDEISLAGQEDRTSRIWWHGL